MPTRKSVYIHVIMAALADLQRSYNICCAWISAVERLIGARPGIDPSGSGLFFMSGPQCLLIL